MHTIVHFKQFVRIAYVTAWFALSTFYLLSVRNNYVSLGHHRDNDWALCDIHNHMFVIHDHSGSHCLEAELFVVKQSKLKYVHIHPTSD
jgi:hypothetical protein